MKYEKLLDGCELFRFLYNTFEYGEQIYSFVQMSASKIEIVTVV